MIVLDTHVFIWLLSQPKMISKRAKQLIDKAMKEKNIWISAISIWEIANLVSKKRLVLSIEVSDWIAKSETLPFLNFMPIDNRIALKSVNLPRPLHQDPADRLIIATTLILGAVLITKDEKILNYPPVKTIW